ncbi:MAG: DUF642 domain-containing protein [Chloroflexi bacterium]|nr:DUF642 domain-containing protein [Chloroflexota bacterium]
MLRIMSRIPTRLLVAGLVLATLVVLLLAPRSSARAIGPNLLTNGGFDSGAAPGPYPQPPLGWTLDFGDIDIVANYPSGWQTSDGSAYSLDLNGFHPGGISQSFSTVPGLTYQVLFALSKNPGATSGATLEVWTGTSHASPDALQSFSYSAATSNAAMGWTQQTFTFTATSTTTTLHFWSTTTGPLCLTNQYAACGPALDNIRVPQLNQPPTANAGGPYSVPEGGSVQLNGAGSDPDNDPLTYAWDLDNNGTFETPGQSVTFSAAGRDGPSNQTVVLRVCDENACATSNATVNVLNVAPTVDAGPDAENFSGDTHHVSATFGDPGVNDAPWSYTMDFGDGNTVSGSTNDQSAPITGSHRYFVPGAYTVTVCVTDKDGGIGCDSHIKTVVRLPAAINNKPGSNPNSTNLRALHVPVAILTTKAGEYGLPRDFDATKVDISKTVWGTKANFQATGSGGTEVHGELHIEDSIELGNPETVKDGDLDGVAHFSLKDSGVDKNTTETCVWGVTIDGVHFVGCDALRVVGK